MKVDLHIHSTASDGAWSPERLVFAALEGGLDLIALADHDTTAGVEAAVVAARGTRLQVVPAIELSTTWHGRELHVLGYFVDPEAAPLRAHVESATGARVARIEVMISRLGEAGIPVEMASVLAQAGPERGVLGRPHLAMALVEAGHVRSLDEAFERFLGDGLPAFVPTALLEPAEGVQLVLAAGGVPVWAHPPGDLVDTVLPQLVAAGLRGLEVYRPLSAPRQVRRLESVARSAGLVVTGGSDWHGPDRGRPLGEFFVPSGRVAQFLEQGLQTGRFHLPEEGGGPGRNSDPDLV
jgi:hypothetical protein